MMQSVLDGLNEEEKKKILRIGKAMSYQKGKNIVQEGTPGEEFYIIEAGKVLISKPVKEGEKTLAILEKGDFFGEMSLLDGGPHSANARAMEDVNVLSIQRKAFEEMLKTDYATASRFLFAVIKIMSERLRSTSEELVALYETGRIIGSSSGLADILSRTLKTLLDVTGSSCGLFMLNNQFTGELDARETKGIKDVDKDLAMKLMKAPMGTLVNNLEKDEGIKGKIDAEDEISSFIASPLKVREKSIGLVLLCKKSGDTFTGGRLNLLSAVASQIATAVENAMLNEEAKDRKKLDRRYVTY